MKPIKLSLVIVCFLGLVFGLSPQVFASGGGPAPGDVCCALANPGGGASAMQGTMALVYDPHSKSVDVTLRLKRSGEQHFFRLNLSPLPLEGLNNEAIVCLILNPGESENPDIENKVRDFVNEILETFFNGLNAENTKLGITLESITDCQGIYGCIDSEYDPVYCVIPDTDRVSSLGDITIYAVDINKINYLNPGVCQTQP